MGLVTLTKVKDYIQETGSTYDTFLQEQIDLISEVVEAYCGRKFEVASYVQTFEAQAYMSVDKFKIYTYHYPVTTITEIKELDGGSLDEEVITDYTPDFKTGILRKVDSCNRREQWFQNFGATSQVEVSYDAGYAIIPAAIQDTVCALVAERYNKRKSGVDLNFGSDVQRLSIPGVMSIDFDYTLQANERSVRFGMILGNYVNNLDHYRSERVITGEIRENYVS